MITATPSMFRRMPQSQSRHPDADSHWSDGASSAPHSQSVGAGTGVGQWVATAITVATTTATSRPLCSNGCHSCSRTIRTPRYSPACVSRPRVVSRLECTSRQRLPHERSMRWGQGVIAGAGTPRVRRLWVQGAQAMVSGCTE
jgi:hypothetical protein